MGSRYARTPFAAALLVLLCASAWAQDYTVTTPAFGSRYENPPATGVSQLFTTEDDASKTITLPFNFVYFGQSYSTVKVCTNQFLQFGPQTWTDWSNVAINALSSGMDGMVAPFWEDTYPGTGGGVKWWVSGQAPDRRVVVAWENYREYYESTQTQYFTLQAQLFEQGGRIVFSYKPGGTWPGPTYCSWTLGLDAVSPDSRFIIPTNVKADPAQNAGGAPPTDYQFDPRTTTFTGRVLYDRYLVDSSGIGNALEQAVPLAGLRVDLRNDQGAAVGSGYCDASGNFTVLGTALVGTSTGSLVATAQSVGAVVRGVAGGLPLGFTIQTNVSFGSDLTIPPITINETTDPGGTARAALNIARSIQQVHTWAQSRTTTTIPQLEVLYDSASTLATSYTKGASPVMRVAGLASGNPDPWDGSVIRKTYGRHVIGRIAGDPTTAYDSTFDKATDDQNAFAEAFGYYLNAVVSLDPKYYDGIDKSNATVLNLESPTLTAPMGSNVAGWIAAALFDLTDAANEPWDPVDGTLALDKPFLAADSLTAAATAASFYNAWGVAGYDPGMSTLFIHNGLVVDDDDESNDTADTAAVVPQFGFVHTKRVLNRFNDDWYEFIMTQSTTSLTAQVVYDRLLNVTIALEITTPVGQVLATGAAVGDYGPIVAQTGALPAGKYRVHVQHVTGIGLPDYTIQAFPALEFSSGEFRPWTVGHPYDVPVNVKGGIPPYTLTVEQPFVKPQGLDLTSVPGRVTGTPTAPGHYGFVLSARDSAIPSNIASGGIDFQVNDELEFSFDELIALPYDKSLDLVARYSGGTAPFTSEVFEGTLPHGVSIAPGEFRFVGRPDVPGSYTFALRGTDVASSTATARTTGVVCIPFGTTPLAMGKSSCGFYFDAVAGTSVKIGVKTSKKRAKRALAVTMFGADGATAVPAPASGGSGKASVSGFVAPTSGRYYCVVSSDTGEATELVGTGKLTPPKGGAGSSPDSNFVQGKTLAVRFGALSGAVFSIKATPDKSGLALRAVYMIDPDGNYLTFAPGEVTEKNGSIAVTKPLNAAGTWQFVIGAAPGPQGAFKYSYKVTQPKGGVFSAD